MLQPVQGCAFGGDGSSGGDGPDRNAATAVGRVGKIRSSPIESSSPAARRSARRSCLTRASASTIPRRCSSACSASSASAAVLSISTFASALSRNHRGGSGCGLQGGERAAAEVLGVGEAQRGVVAVDEQSGDGLGVGVVVDVVHAGDPGHVAEHAVVRAGEAAQQVEHREADRDQHAVEHPDGQDGDHRDHGDRRLAAAEAGDPPEPGDVDQPQRRVDDDGAERGAREPRQQRAARDQDRRPPARARPASAAASGCPGRRRSRSGCRCCSPGTRAARPRPGSRRRARPARRCRRMVSPRRVGEGAGGEHVVRVADDRDPDGREQQRGQVVDGQRRQPRHRQPARRRTRPAATPRSSSENSGDDGGRGSMPIMGTGQVGRSRVPDDHADEQGQRQRDGRQVRLGRAR